ncbi:TIGR02588 family protein [Catalinimonas alkaloidigena]|uniref:TIGR02588 family protein n=1 Tax=Catalinimonas alkaloidigena TaxID=1075417 RepID=A0A1G9ISJ8_9BACT|nr:hypothetical protein [Catalinimonas alkaloidigena]SDL28258.1 TIGR02588 family protein [Catalinimonas alkaloidigena]
MKPEKNGLEWSVFGISLLLIAAALAFLGYLWATRQPTPPDLQATAHPAEPHADYYAVPVTVTNQGGMSAESVQLEVVLETQGQALETGELTFDYCPRQSTRNGWVGFHHNPAQADTVRVRVVSYLEP